MSFTFPNPQPIPTQMIILPISPNTSIEKPTTREGKIWNTAVDIAQSHPGYRRLYWGRHVETPEKTQLHIARETLHQHYAFLASSAWKEFQRVVSELAGDEQKLEGGGDGGLVVRHAMLMEWGEGVKGLGRGAPVTGTAIYLGTEEVVWDAAWTLWSTIVPGVKGCLGVAGGYVVEPVNGHERCFIAWVGWENVEVHDDYHHTKDFQRKGVILWQGHKGFQEYGHVAFKHSREKEKGKL